MESDEVSMIVFDDHKEHGIVKFSVEVDMEVMNFLDKFQDCVSLCSLSNFYERRFKLTTISF